MKLPDLAAKQAYLNPDRLAFIDPDRGREFTYAELNDRANRIAGYLAVDWGVTRGTRVATLAHNRVEAAELLFACAKLGAVLVPINWRLAAPEIAYILGDAQVRGIVHDGAHADLAQTLSGMCHGDDGPLRLLTMDTPSNADNAALNYETALAQASGTPRDHEPRDEEDLWFLIYTSGTTGKPKGVHQTAGMALVNYLNIGIATQLVRNDVFYSVLPQFHTGGWGLYLLPMTILGGTTILPSGFNVDATMKALATQTTVFFGVPAIYQAIAEHPKFAETDFSRIRSWAAGGASMPVPLLERLSTRGIEVRQGMGMTETGPTAFLLDAENAVRKAGSVGKPQTFVDVRIVDGDGNDVSRGDRGEILFRGPGVTPGYWNDPKRTAEAFYPGGWLRSGDIGIEDDEGFYYVVDRAKDMYISGGENVYPAEIEAVLAAVPQIRSCAVIGVPDERWGEVGKVFIEIAPGETLTAAEIRAHCQQHLARYKVPVHVEFVASLPRNATGKILKHILRERSI